MDDIEAQFDDGDDIDEETFSRVIGKTIETEADGEKKSQSPIFNEKDGDDLGSGGSQNAGHSSTPPINDPSHRQKQNEVANGPSKRENTGENDEAGDENQRLESIIKGIGQLPTPDFFPFPFPPYSIQVGHVL